MDNPSGPSGNSRKRKAKSELSQNVHTARARKRKENLSQDENSHKIEKAKAADQGAITYAKKKLRETKEWLSASVEDRDKMLSDVADTVRLRRYANSSILIIILTIS